MYTFMFLEVFFLKTQKLYVIIIFKLPETYNLYVHLFSQFIKPNIFFIKMNYDFKSKFSSENIYSL